MWEEYTWILVLGAFLCVFMSWGIGANDVANSFATSVGSRTLTLFWACVLAGICEFAGASLLGRGVTDTIRNNILNVDQFEYAPEIIMFGMLCALFSAAVWLVAATFFEMPVSTTHSIIGAIIGVGLVAGGGDAVVWASIDHEQDFPLGGVAAIVVSWVFSPVVSGAIAAVFFWLTRTFILRSADSFGRAYNALPILVFVCIFINLYYILIKGVTKQADLSYEKAAWITAVCAAACALASIGLAQWLKRRQLATEGAAADKAADVEAGEDGTGSGSGSGDGVEPAAEEGSIKGGAKGKASSFFQRLQDKVNENNPHKALDEFEDVAAMHAGAEVFENRTERAFSTLQVLTSMAASFAHGANDVANAVGPFAAIWTLYRTGDLSSESNAEEWILILGGTGIVLGLSTYGYKIIRAIGVKLTKITPSRGYCMELATSLVVVTGSYLNLPLSTTHCIVGATTAVGLMEGRRGAVSWKVLVKAMVGWVITLVVAGLLSALVFSIGVFSPNLRSAQALAHIEGSVVTVGLGITGRVAQQCSRNFVQDTIVEANNTIQGVAIDNAAYPNRIADVLVYLGQFNNDTSTVACPRSAGGLASVPSAFVHDYPSPYVPPSPEA